MDKVFVVTAVAVVVPMVTSTLAELVAVELKLGVLGSLALLTAVDVVALYLAFKAVL